jgi:hypothetical protein
VHWRRPKILWYQGSHMSIAMEPEVRSFIDTTLRETGLV